MMSAQDDHYNDQNDHFLDSDHDDDRDDDRDDDHASHQSAGAKWPQPQQELGIAGPSGTLTLNSTLLLMSELLTVDQQNKHHQHQHPDTGINICKQAITSFELLQIYSNTSACSMTPSLKIAIYCPQGSGTLRQQSLMMH